MNELQVIEKALQGAKCRKAEIDFPIEQVIEKANEIAAKYRNAIYTDEMVKTCKSDKAEINKVIKSLETFRKNTKKSLSEEITNFEKEMKRVVQIMEEPLAVIQIKVDEFEEKRKKEKQEQIDLVYARAIETCELDQKYVNRIEIKPSYYNATMTVNKIDKDLQEQISSLKVEQQFEKSKYDLIDTKVELYNLKLGLQIGVTAKSLYYLVELDTLEEIDEKVLELVTDQKTVEDENIARLEREAKEKAEKEKQAEIDKIEADKKAELKRIEDEKQAEIKKQVAAQTKEITEKAEESMKVAETVMDQVEKFMPVEALPTEKVFERTIKVKATKNQLISLREFMNASGIEVL